MACPPPVQSRALVSEQVVRVEALVTSVQQMDGPGIGIAVLCGSEKIAVGGVGINAHQNRLIAVENIVTQTNPNPGEVLGFVNVCGALSSY